MERYGGDEGIRTLETIPRHATRVYEQPFLSVFVWLENVNSPCNVIHFDDWAEVEQDLAKLPN